MELLIAYAALAIGVSFVCSLLEASLLSMPRSHIEVLIEKGSKTGLHLKNMTHNIDRPLTAILTFNTIANTVGAVGVGAQAATVFGSRVIGIAIAVLTLLILVFSEIIPKTLGVIHAKSLAGVTALLTRLMMVLCFPLIAALEWISRVLGYTRRTEQISRAELLASIRLGHKGGVLEKREFYIISNLLALDSVKLGDVLTPRTVMFTLQQDMTVEQVIAEHQPIRFARFPIYRKSVDDITGYVTRYDVRKAYFAGDYSKTLEQIAKPIEILPEQACVADALEMMLHKQQHIVLVVDEHGGTAGIVTLEDTLETLLGQEIVDETDLVVDMQKLAKARKAKRFDKRSIR
jgi:CBS domain containing-hemolysin-like protein